MFEYILQSKYLRRNEYIQETQLSCLAKIKFSGQPSTPPSPHPNLCLEASNKLVSKSLDAVGEVCAVGGLPLGAVLAWDSLVTHETDVQDIVGVVSVVTSEVLVGEAELAEGDGGFTCGGAAVGVTPDAVVLFSM